MTFHDLITLFARYVRRIGDTDIVQMCGLAEGSTSATLKTTNAVVCNLYNQALELKVADDIAITACTQQAIGTFCYYLVSVSLDQTITTTKGTNNSYSVPSCPQGSVPIGAFKVVTDGSHTFTAGTTDLGATGITTTFYDIDCGMAASCINQAMNQVERSYNFNHMKVRTTTTIADAAYTLTNPFTTYKQLISAYLIDSNGKTYPPLVRVDREVAMRRYPYLSDYEDRPLYISTIPVTEATLTPDALPTFQFLFRPTSDATYTVDMEAYQFSPALDGVIYSTNWWTQNEPEVLLYGGLVKIAPFLKDDDRIPTWKQMYSDHLSALIEKEKSVDFAGAELYVENPYMVRTERVDDYGE